MPDELGPMVSRRQLGNALRHYRTEANLTLTEAAARLLVNPSKVSRIENAQRNATIRDVRDLCAIYGIEDPAVRERLMELARGSRERAWWQGVSIPPGLQKLIGLEGAAQLIKEFEPLAIPGLLQTRDYATAITPPYAVSDPALVKEIVDARMRRQKIFEQESGPELKVVLDEAVIQRVVGGPTVMRDQIDHLIELAGASKLTLQVIPFEAGVHIGMNGGFTILEFGPISDSEGPDNLQPTVYLEALDEHIFTDQPDDLEKYQSAFSDLSRQAHNKSLTLTLLRARSKSLR